MIGTYRCCSKHALWTGGYGGRGVYEKVQTRQSMLAHQESVWSAEMKARRHPSLASTTNTDKGTDC